MTIGGIEVTAKTGGKSGRLVIGFDEAVGSGRRRSAKPLGTENGRARRGERAGCSPRRSSPQVDAPPRRRFGDGRLCGARRRPARAAAPWPASPSRAAAATAPIARRPVRAHLHRRAGSRRRGPDRHPGGGPPRRRRGGRSARPAAARHIRARGSDFARGDVLLGPGRLLDARALVAAAGADLAEVEVWRRPRLVIIGTGDELVAPGSARATPGAIPESVSLGVAALAEDWGAESSRASGSTRRSSARWSGRRPRRVDGRRRGGRHRRRVGRRAGLRQGDVRAGRARADLLQGGDQARQAGLAWARWAGRWSSACPAIPIRRW